ncbi:sodium/proline symporter [Thermotomaculum hydrothermale]|uniref:Sodium/proline symporter n=1 Tax=Thermotomaculum hydrothermale TaxID=981385 RepID=A0A7R6SZ54_9BACT|nr:sodium/proline symporter [Thermotomaculum hydrothermale]BBB33286.1 sodium/proline symporter [Thermotomaculum hydrothermale]
MGVHSGAVFITFVIYLIALLVIGYIGDKKFSKSYEDFVTAGKSLGAIVTALSAAASSESAWVMLGLSGLGYKMGFAAYWAAIGCVLGFAANWLFIIAPVRRLSGKLNSLTLADMIEDALEDRKKLLRIIGSLIIVFFMGAYVVSQFVGAGKTFQGMEIIPPNIVNSLQHSVGNLFTVSEYTLGVLIGALIIGAYILMGGYAAVCWTDALQGFLMVFILVILPIYAVFQAGGVTHIIEALKSANIDTFWTLKGATLWGSIGFILGQLGIGLGYQGMPHVVVRYITVKDEDEGKRAGLIGTLWSFFVLFGSVTLGIASRAIFPQLTDPEQALPKFTAYYLHPVLAGIVLSAITAAIMSTADSQLMYAATSLVNDLWLKLTKKEVDRKKLVLITRSVIVIMTLIALVIALNDVKVIYSFVLYAWGALGAAFSPLVILLLYDKRFNKWGALANLIVGPIVIIVWKNIPALSNTLYELIPGFLLSLIAGIIVSRLTGKEERELAV